MTRRRTPSSLALFTGVALLFALVASLAGAPTASAAKCKGANAPAYETSTKQARKATLCLLNLKRRKAGMRPLKEDREARKAAKRHTRVMLKKDCFAHLCPGELDLGGRFAKVGYTSCGCSWSVGENIAWGQGERSTPRFIVSAWMKSPGHRANILNRSFEDIGIAVMRGAPNGNSNDLATFTTTFGSQR